MKVFILWLIGIILIGTLYIQVLKKESYELKKDIENLTKQLKTITAVQQEKEERYAKETANITKTLDSIEKVKSDWSTVDLPNSVINILSNTTYGNRNTTLSGSK